jgi:hypothetical protein
MASMKILSRPWHEPRITRDKFGDHSQISTTPRVISGSFTAHSRLKQGEIQANQHIEFGDWLEKINTLNY